ncbi:MAG: FHA domain-containing protein, partial [Oscillospiraceae bacterium]|nr:FHA domain-containing protein [Oscillospiraceae bacterium]
MYYSIQLIFGNRVCERILSLDDGNESFIDISDLTKKKDCVISFEKSEGKLRIKNDGSILVTGDDVIRDGHCNEIEIKGTVLTGALFVSALDENSVCFESFCPERSVIAGSGNDCDIIIKGDYISRRHAEISCDGGVFSIKDISENGIFVNGKKIEGKRQLDPFDIIWIFGAKIVFAGDSIAVQKNSFFAGHRLVNADTGYETASGRKNTAVKNGSLRSFSLSEKDCEAELELPGSVTAGRKKHGVSEIMKTAVPASAVLSAAAALRGALTVPQILAAFAAGTAAVTGIWLGAERVAGMVTAKRDSSDRKEELKKYEGLLAEKQENFRLMMNERFPDAREAAHMFAEGRRRIVPPSDEDFLKVRIGTGKASFERFIKTGGTPDKQLEELVKKYRYAGGVPAEADLKTGKVFHVAGKREAVTEFIRSMAVKISASFDPENVKMMFILPDGDTDGVSFVKWLPHTFSSDRKIRFTGFDDLSAAHMEEIISSLLKRETMNHHLIVFASDDSLLSSSEVKKYLNSDREGKIVFIISRYSDEENLAFSGPEKTVLTDSED